MPQTHVFFDFDSTLITCESLDLIAQKKGVLKDIEAMTNQAMNGEVPLESVLDKKMSIINPTHNEMLEAAYDCLSHITSGARDIIILLQSHNIIVHILSSGFHEIIDPVAHVLTIPPQHIHANTIQFDEKDNYVCIDPTSILTHSNGKPTYISQHTTPNDITYMIGDGMTDAACAPVVTQFIGFGGNIVRNNVRKNSNIYITEKNLTAIIPYITI
mgnify:CR=1 FL=1